MKKGFILALLMVAMVALVLPVAARAPIVNMPKVIIGDADAGDTGGGKGIMRYINAVNLKNPTFVDWNNDDTYTSDLFKAYLYNPQTLADPDVVAARPTRLVDTLTSVEFNAIFASNTTPAASACITSYTGTFDFFWLSLLDTTRHPAITNAYLADPATDGVAPDTYNKTVDMMFVAGVTSGTRIVATSGTLTVVCQSGATDKATIGRDDATYTFTGGADAWTYGTVASLLPAAQYTTATGIGFNIPSAATAITHGSWKSPSSLAGSSAMAGRVYRASAVLSSNAANKEVCPGFRLTFANDGFSHFGAVVNKTMPSVVAPETNVPITGANFNARVYWTVPTTLGDFGDTEGQATFATLPGGFDMRKYFVTFDTLATIGDVGNLVMEEMVVSSFPRPASKAKAVAWGSAVGEIGFSAAATAGGWVKDADVTGFIAGNLTRNAGNMVANLKNGSGKRYLPALAQGYTGAGLPVGQLAPVSGHLYRFSYNVVCASQTAAPCYRVSINGVDLTPGVGLAYRNMFWSDFQSFSNMTPIAKQATFKLTNQVNSPGAPNLASDPAGPSLIETYVYSHNVAAQSGTSYHNIFPLISLVDKGLWTVAGSVWQDPTTDMTISAAGWEDLGADY